MATQEQVLEIHRKRPDMPAPDIAALLDCTSGYVRATARRLKITLPGRPDSIEALGHAARDAGLTVRRIQELQRTGALRS